MHRKLAETIELFSRGLGECKRAEDRKLVNDYLALLATLLARAVLGEDILRDIDVVDRLFGKTWIVDVEPFEEAFNTWHKFRDEYENFSLSGMTVNERLFALDLLEDFDRACLKSDEIGAREILMRARVDTDSINEIIKTSINNG